MSQTNIQPMEKLKMNLASIQLMTQISIVPGSSFVEKRDKLEKVICSLEQNLEKETSKLERIRETNIKSMGIILVERKILFLSEKLACSRKNLFDFEESIRPIIKLEDDLRYIEEIENMYDYHIKVLGTLETYRKKWTIVRGETRMKMNEMNKALTF